jgi:two-component system, NarL family, invasion response regulator UvrY
MIRVLVIDDHTLVRAGLCRLLESEENIEVVAQGGTGQEAIELCKSHRPDLVLLDYGLPDIDGLEVTERLTALALGARVLVLTMHANEEYALRVMRAGAAGFIIKGASTDELLAAVRKVMAGGSYVSPSIQERLVDRLQQADEQRPEASLSNREMQVLLLLARGASTREVAAQLLLSLSTVETYRSRLLEKLNLRNNSDMTRFAIRRGLIEPS